MDDLSILRAGLLDSYRHRAVEGFPCALCGTVKRPLALHLVEWSQPAESAVLQPDLMIAMSRSNTTGEDRLRGSFGFCDECAPPCKKCGLPIRTKAIEDFQSKQQAVAPDPDAYWIGLGIGKCDHAHPFLRRRAALLAQGIAATAHGRAVDGRSSMLEAKAKYIEEHVVEAELAERCTARLDTANSGKRLVLVSIETYGTEMVPIQRIEQLAREWLLREE